MAAPSDFKPDERQREQTISQSRLMRERMLRAMRALEDALAKAAYQREPIWRERVRTVLKTLGDVLQQQTLDLTSDVELLSDISHESPWLLPRIDKLRDRAGQLRKELADLQEEFAAESESDNSVKYMRLRLARFLADLRDFQAEETDLIFEAIQVDLGDGD